MVDENRWLIELAESEAARFWKAPFEELTPPEMVLLSELALAGRATVELDLELTTGGKNPIALPNGEQRTWLEDGDSVVLRGWCEREGAARIGFGECVGTVLPARVPKA